MPSTETRRWLILPVILSATFMAILDVFIVNVAAPSLRHDLGASAASVQWVVDGYALAFATALITGGRLGDVIGRRRAFRIGVGAFTLSSALCGAAPSPTALVGARALQGLSCALMMPQVLSIIQVEFEAHERRRCLAIMGGVQGAASVCGQLVGGALIGLDVLGLGWRTVFLINVPVGLAAVVAAGRLVPESRSRGARRPDLPGVALGSIVALLVVFPIVEGRAAGWPWWVPAALVAALPVGAAWAAYERSLTARGGAPLVDLSLFRLRGYRLGLALALLFYTGLTCVFFLLGLYLQDGLGLSPLESGLAFTPLAVPFVAATLIAPRYFARVGDRLIAYGSALMAPTAGAVAIGVATTHPSGPTPELIAGLSILCIGPGIVVPGLIHAVLRSVPAESAGSASGVLTTAQQMGNALGVAIAGAIFFGALGDGVGAHAYDRAFAIALAWSVATAALSTVLALRVAAAAPPRARDAAGADTVRPAMGVDTQQLEVARRAA
jgi:EmrB/QacA subfamily drug resistance transporter